MTEATKNAKWRNARRLRFTSLNEYSRKEDGIEKNRVETI